MREIASYCNHHHVNSLDTLDRSLFLTHLSKLVVKRYIERSGAYLRATPTRYTFEKVCQKWLS